MRCNNCHYSLANLTGPPHRCPECGREFDPADSLTFETEQRRRGRVAAWVGIAYIIVFCTATFILSIKYRGGYGGYLVAPLCGVATAVPAIVAYRLLVRRLP